MLFWIATAGFVLAWACYLNTLRSPLREQAELHTSRSFRRKTLKGFRNRIFYTCVRERCCLDERKIYLRNQINFWMLSACTLAHFACGWAPALADFDKLLSTLLFTVVAGQALFLRPHSDFAAYKKRGQSDFTAFLCSAVMEVCTFFALLLWYYCAFWLRRAPL